MTKAGSHSLLLITCLCLLLTACKTSEESTQANRRARVLQVQAQTLHPTLIFPARSRAAKSVNLSFRVSGQLIDLPILVGQEVKKRQILGQIDPRDFMFQIKNIEGNILQAQASLRLAEAEFERFSNLYQRDPGAVSTILVKQKKENVNNLLGQLKSVQASLETSKTALDDTFLYAPYNSTIVAVFVDNYQQVNAGQSIVRLISTEEIEVLIDVPDRIIASIKDAKNIQVQFDAVPNVLFPATIEEIGTEASQTTRTFPVTLVVIPPEGTYLFPGMTGTALLEQSTLHSKEESTFKLPLSSLLSRDGETSIVWVADPATWQISAKSVKIINMAHQYAIITGLSDNDWVVVSGVNFINDKQTISPLSVRIDESGEIFSITNQPISDHHGSKMP